MSINFRINLLLFFFLFLATIIASRLFVWQILKGGELAKLGKIQQKTSSNLIAERGSILASDGSPIVTSSIGWIVWANPEKVKDKTYVAKVLSEILSTLPEKPKIDKEATLSAEVILDEKSYEEKKKELVEYEEKRILSTLSRDAVYVSIKNKITNDKKLEIESLGIEGIGFDPQELRIYPEASVAAHVTGFVGVDSVGSDKGYFGLEGKFDVALSGVTGEKTWERDGLGNPILAGKSLAVNALNGANLKTHIDKTVQYTIEKYLDLGLSKYGASSGTVIVMRPKDGAILGMASRPTYIQSEFAKFNESEFLNPAISESFEPGSIFKVLVMAAALDGAAVKEDDQCDICKGRVQIGKYSIGTWDDKYYPNSTPIEIIQHSDNTGMIWVASRTGQQKFFDYISKFGIGSKTGIDLQGEAVPLIRDKNRWGQIDLATASFGQGIAVTPIQMVKALSGIANNGRLSTPQVVDKIITDGWEEDIKPELSEPVISDKTAKAITNMMINAVKAGEAKWAAPKGYLIAGKTGTAQIPVSGHYDSEKTIASFFGFAPADNPEFLMLVTLKESQSSPWASETSAPLWFSIAKELFLHLGIRPH